MKRKIHLTVNGEEYELEIEPNRTLLKVLREDLGLTGTKEGCGKGDCGSCTVLVEGKAVNACLTLAMQVQGKPITTIEGLAAASGLHPLQDAFIRYGAIQCGFCSPGMILSAKALLDETPHPTEEEVKRALAGNLCRCTGYTKIIEAVMAVAKGGPS